MKKTEKIVKSLIKRNLVVNAGLAKGIDTVTHKSALQNGGRTIAVIGTPINQYYPKENKEFPLLPNWSFLLFAHLLSNSPSFV